MYCHVLITAIFLSLSASLVAQSANRENAANRTAMLSASGEALQALQSKSDGTWKVSKNRDTGLPRMLMGAKSASYGTNAVDAAQHFIQENSDLFLPGNAGKPQDERVTLKVSSTKSLPGSTVVGFDEEYKGLSVYGASVIVMVDSSGRVVHVTSTADPRAIVPTTPAKTFQEVDSILKDAQTNKALRLTAATNTLVILPGDKPRLAYQAFYKVGDSDEPWAYLLDAATGETLKAIRLVQEDAIRPRTNAPSPTAARLRNAISQGEQGRTAARPLATCKASVDLTAPAAQSSGTPTISASTEPTRIARPERMLEGTPGTTTYELDVATDFIGGEDEDADGYYDTYHLQIGIEGYASPGPATVYAKLICETTGQRWRSRESWTITEIASDSRYFGFDETAFSGDVCGSSSLDFTVELWDSENTGRVPEETPINAEPRWTSSSATSARTWNTGRWSKQTAIRPKTAETSALAASLRTLVFDPNPVNTLNNTNLTDPYVEVDLTPYLTVPPLGLPYRLIGEFVKMEDIELPSNTPPTSSNQVFRYHRDDPAFEEVMCYYHVTRNQEYIQSLGFTNINNRPQRIDAHGLEGNTNSLAYYRPSPVGSGYMAFRDDGVDAAEDADVILHEYAHAIQDNSTAGRYLWSNDRGYGDETRAMGEGFAYYWACSCTYSQSVANGFDPAIVDEWAIFPYTSRRVNPDKHYPEDMSKSDIYQSCGIWSACLWDIFNAIGKQPADTIILASHFLVPPRPSFEDGAYAVLVADTGLYNGTHTAQIWDIFVARGILMDDTAPMSSGTFQFASPTYSANESAGTVALTVTRIGGSLGAASVNYAMPNGTATAGADYTATSGTLNWADGDTAPKTFTVTLLDDAIQEGNETFHVQMSAISGARPGSPTAATVTILDDDGGAIIGAEVWSPSSSGTSSSRTSSSGRRATSSASSSSGRHAGGGAHMNSGGTALSAGGGGVAPEVPRSSSASQTPAPTDSDRVPGRGLPDLNGSAQNGRAGDWTPVQVSLFPPFQMLSSDRAVIGVRANLLMGYNARVTGVDVGTVANQAGDMHGLQVAIGNQAMCLQGIQVGLANQIGFLGPPQSEAHKRDLQPVAQGSDAGLQIGLMNSVGRTSPLSPDETPESRFSGIQVGIMNFADDMNGIQIGALGNQADEVTGLQMSLFWNQARVLHGVQIGLINGAGNGLLRDSLGGVPIINAAF